MAGPDEKTVIVGSDQLGKGIQPPYLVVVDGPHKGSRHPLREGKNVIGRLDECHVALDDQSVSRKHAELKLLEQGWTVEDLQSKNGTHVNGALIDQPVVIGHKDLIRVGLYTLRFVAEPITAEEEMSVSKDLIGEWKAEEVPAGAKEEGITARVDVKETGGASQLVTDEHSPLEETPGEEEEYEVVEEVVEEEEEGEGGEGGGKPPRARIFLLAGILFALVLGGGLYAYWQYVLVPQQAAEEEASRLAAQRAREKKERERRVQAIPLGPPVPDRPAQIPVFLDCVANPFPAAVTFQGKELGKTPLRVNVELEPEKTYEIEAHFEMTELGETYTDRVPFKTSPEESMVPILFKAPAGTIKIVSLPRDATLYLEAFFEYDKFSGRPIKLSQIILNKPLYAPFGRYILELRQPKEVSEGSVADEIVYRREFHLQEESPVFTVDLDEKSLKEYPVEIRSVPSGALVYLDQAQVGKTPYFGTVAVGKHRLTVRKEGFFEDQREIEMAVNMPLKLEVLLKTSPAGEKINQAKDHMKRGLYAEAIPFLAEVFNLNPTPGETAEARYVLGNIYLRLGDLPKARGYFEQAKGHPDYQWWAKLGIVSVLASEEKIEEALLPLVEVLLNARDEEILGEAKKIFHQISPLRSVVYVQSDPPGAAVYLNDEKMGEMTPLLLHEVGLGSYRLAIEKAGFETVHLKLDVSVNEFNPVLVELKALPE